jgi:alpha-beta hydrolase superfamily lysophospholipase
MTLDGYFEHTWHRLDPSHAAEIVATHYAALENVSVRAADGVVLRGWLFTPRKDRGRVTLLVHGGTGNRRGMLERSEWLMEDGYACLLIDQRGCGESGGVVSFGVHEPGDVAVWTRWVRERTHANEVFGYGQSRGGTTLIQSLVLRPGLDAIAAECAGPGEIGQPYRFVAERMGVSERTAKMVAWPLIEPSFWWVRQRFGVDLKSVRSGLAAMRGNQAPVLLLQGTKDRVNPLAGAERLRDADPAHTELATIPGVDHDWFDADRPLLAKRVAAWFDKH